MYGICLCVRTSDSSESYKLAYVVRVGWCDTSDDGEKKKKPYKSAQRSRHRQVLTVVVSDDIGNINFAV